MFKALKAKYTMQTHTTTQVLTKFICFTEILTK